MVSKKRFQKQELNSSDYEKTETGAKLVKNGIKITGGLSLAVVTIKKYGPEFVRGFKRVIKK